jgi:hypothetical protein
MNMKPLSHISGQRKTQCKLLHSRRVRALLADLIRIDESGDHPKLPAQIKVTGDTRDRLVLRTGPIRPCLYPVRRFCTVRYLGKQDHLSRLLVSCLFVYRQCSGRITAASYIGSVELYC